MTAPHSGSISIADLLSGQPPGFSPAAGPAAAFAKPHGRDVPSFWAACPRGDWMLFIAGWCGLEARTAVRVGLSLLAQPDLKLDAELEAVRSALSRFVEHGERSEILATHDREEPGEVTDLVRHMLAASLRQACAIAVAPGRLLGPSYPVVCSQLALYPARAVGGGLRPDAAFLARAAELVRSSIDAPELPTSVPSSWTDAVDSGWAAMAKPTDHQ